MIPKIIHCCWLGGRKTRLAERCRASWTRFAPDFEIREWGPDEIARLRADGKVPRYAEEALAAKKWAFASDWLRFVVLGREGGVYFDFDVELVRPIDDLLSGEWCAGERVCRNARVQFAPGAGIALARGSAAARRMIAAYDGIAFGDGRTVGDIMDGLGLDLKLLAPEVFCPIDWQGRSHVTEATRGIHRYALSWITPQRRLARWLNWHGLSSVVDVLLAVKRRFVP